MVKTHKVYFETNLEYTFLEAWHSGPTDAFLARKEREPEKIRRLHVGTSYRLNGRRWLLPAFLSLSLRNASLFSHISFQSISHLFCTFTKSLGSNIFRDIRPKPSRESKQFFQ